MDMFFKKYKTILIITFVLLIIAMILFFVSKEGEIEDGYSRDKQKIASPYEVWSGDLKITATDFEKKDIPKEGKILKVQGFNTGAIVSFVSHFYEISEDTGFSQDVAIQFNDKDFIFFFPETGILSVTSQKGLPLNSKIESEEDLEVFFKEYFNINEIKLSDTNISNSGDEYSGKFVFYGIEIGSSFLNSDSFVVKTNPSGEIISMSMLLLEESNIQKFQHLPTIEIQEVIKNSKYPKMMGENIIEARYYNQSNPYSLVEYYVKDFDFIYIFNDITNGYILPTYLLKGDGKIEDSYGNEYWSETEFFVCALDSTYLLVRERDDITEENEIKEQEGVPFID